MSACNDGAVELKSMADYWEFRCKCGGQMEPMVGRDLRCGPDLLLSLVCGKCGTFFIRKLDNMQRFDVDLMEQLPDMDPHPTL